MTVPELKELCESILVSLKLMISILKIKDPPSLINEDQIKTLIENNPHYTIHELAEMLKISKFTTHEHFVKLDVWVPNEYGKTSDGSHFHLRLTL